ncbi:type II toxin-antitoxin system RelE/ParE family toxin [Clostridium manihotivorum]|uniref:Type II toxin-antitoxin system mRNA interferase toxin, RelE/StbE family n=2 Tax=Clostridium TaxID=1485 RepID=A0A3R5TG76_9CLOT|nr:type II toxin-antitoxin system RelE/ParE family toxin [Clostridium manihotivorum]QAA32738.1 type II toxin-antitoxin system mRNA interferase toxin, RelE/StbE family [Clostridium manihotivorum]
MSAKIRINPVATSDLQEIKSYIAEDNIDAATKVVKEIIEKIESLAEFPEIGTMLMYKIRLKSKYRYVICGQYLIFYIYEDNTVSIQRILHGKRDYMALLQDQKNDN